MINGDRQCLERCPCEAPLQRLQSQPQLEGVPLKGEVKYFVQETYGADYCLNVVVTYCDCHELCEEDKVLCTGRQRAESKEHSEEYPLADVGEDIS